MGLIRMSPCCCLRSPRPVKAARNPRGGGTASSSSGGGGGGEGARLVFATSHFPEYATSRTEMDIALLREQYKCTKEKQMRQNRVVVFRRVSEDLTEAARVVPVTQGLSSLWETRVPPDLTLLPVDPTLMTPDPWHIHLDLHRRINGPAVVGVTLTPQAMRSDIAGSHLPPSYRRHSSLSETGTLKPKHSVERCSVDSAAGLNGSCPNISLKDPQPGYAGSAEAHHLDGSLEIPPRDEGTMGDSLASTPGGYSVGSSVTGDSVAGSLTSFDESDTPVGSSLTPSACGSVTDPGEYDKPLDGSRGGYGLAYHAFGKLAVPAPAPTGQPRCGVQQHPPTLAPGHHHHHPHPNYYPFPNRKSIKKSEAAKKLGMYSHF